MKNQKIYLAAIVVIILVADGLLGWKMLMTKGVSGSEPPVVLQPQVKEKVNLVIDNGEKINNFQIDFKEGMTAFDVLKNKAEELGLNLKTKQYDFGIFIEAIGDKENGQNGLYWMYYVNGELPMVASDKNVIKAGDKVEFKFEKPSM